MPPARGSPSVLDQRAPRSTRRRRLRLVKGSHIVVRRLFDHDRAYIFQNADGRIVFAIPYEGDFTLIGTTDVDLRRRSRPRSAIVDRRDRLSAARSSASYFAPPIERDRRSSGPMPACGRSMTTVASSASAVTRDYVLELDAPDGGAPLLSRLRRQDHHLSPARRAGAGEARQASSRVGRPGRRTRRCRAATFRIDGVGDLVRSLAQRLPFSRRGAPAARCVRAYGTRADRSCSSGANALCRSRPALRRRPHRGARSTTSSSEEWARERRRHPVAALEARPAADRAGARGARGSSRRRQRQAAHGGAGASMTRFECVSRCVGATAELQFSLGGGSPPRAGVRLCRDGERAPRSG